MPNRNIVALSVLMMIILALTVLVSGGTARPPQLGGLAPLLILTPLTWYLIILIANRSGIVAGIAELFKLRREREFVRTSFWPTIVAYASLFILAIVILWIGVPHRILAELQALVVSSGMGGTSNTPQPNQLIGFLPATTFVHLVIVVLAAIFVMSFILLIGGMRLALSTREIRPNDSQLEIEQEAGEVAEVVQQTITALTSDRDKEYHEIILECYKKMCRVLERVGIEVGPAETAREFAEAVSTRLKVGHEAISGLTFLFEEARYSNHKISEDKRIIAVNYLTSLQQGLSANVGMTA